MRKSTQNPCDNPNDQIDCSNHWKLEATINGNCLVYNPIEINGPVGAGSRPQLTVSLLQNISDKTYSWYGAINGFSISYGPEHGQVLRHGHTVMLNSYLAQTISIQRMRKTYLDTRV